MSKLLVGMMLFLIGGASVVFGQQTVSVKAAVTPLSETERIDALNRIYPFSSASPVKGDMRGAEIVAMIDPSSAPGMPGAAMVLTPKINGGQKSVSLVVFGDGSYLCNGTLKDGSGKLILAGFKVEMNGASSVLIPVVLPEDIDVAKNVNCFNLDMVQVGYQTINLLNLQRMLKLESGKTFQGEVYYPLTPAVLEIIGKKNFNLITSIVLGETALGFLRDTTEGPAFVFPTTSVLPSVGPVTLTISFKGSETPVSYVVELR